MGEAAALSAGGAHSGAGVLLSKKETPCPGMNPAARHCRLDQCSPRPGNMPILKVTVNARAEFRKT